MLIAVPDESDLEAPRMPCDECRSRTRFYRDMDSMPVCREHTMETEMTIGLTPGEAAAIADNLEAATKELQFPTLEPGQRYALEALLTLNAHNLRRAIEGTNP